MLTEYVVSLLALTALTLLVTGFVAVFRGDMKHPPGCYFTLGGAATTLVPTFVYAPVWLQITNFVIMLFTARLWAHDLKERA